MNLFIIIMRLVLRGPIMNYADTYILPELSLHVHAVCVPSVAYSESAQRV
jgi:hypothetical protein